MGASRRQGVGRPRTRDGDDPSIACPHVPLAIARQANNNFIERFEDVDLRANGAVSTLYLEHNPLAKDFEYRMRLAREYPSLTQLDATLCRAPRAGYVAMTAADRAAFVDAGEGRVLGTGERVAAAAAGRK